MKSDYVTRAKKFMVGFLPYLDRYGEDGIARAVRVYNGTKHRHVKYYHGIARRCLCLSDYAVKWDYDTRSAERYGGCETEVINYQFACDYGYEYLFAKITRIEVCGRVFYVMPRITVLAMDADIDDYSPDERLTREEYEFVYCTMGLHDLHDENWGFLHGKLIIIDYACSDRNISNTYEES